MGKLFVFRECNSSHSLPYKGEGPLTENLPPEESILEYIEDIKARPGGSEVGASFITFKCIQTHIHTDIYTQNIMYIYT